MPNWCSNTLYLEHFEPKMIKRAKEAFERGELLNEFIPVPLELKDTTAPNREPSRQELIEKYGAGDWYDWCCKFWGTKWDVGDTSGITNMSDDGTSITMYFDSAWSPPIAAYEQLEELGFKIKAMYYESGCCFAGIYDDCGDDYYEFSDMSADEVEEALPDDLNNEFDIVALVREYEEYEEPEPLTEWYKQGVEDRGLNKDE